MSTAPNCCRIGVQKTLASQPVVLWPPTERNSGVPIDCCGSYPYPQRRNCPLQASGAERRSRQLLARWPLGPPRPRPPAPPCAVLTRATAKGGEGEGEGRGGGEGRSSVTTTPRPRRPIARSRGGRRLMHFLIVRACRAKRCLSQILEIHRDCIPKCPWTLA